MPIAWCKMIFFLLMLLAACGGKNEALPSPNADNILSLARVTLDSIQSTSFEENREYCGFIGVAPNGEISVTVPKPGQTNHCNFGIMPRNWQHVSAYHTHGRHTSSYNSEKPSAADLQGHHEFGITGFLATPGGRLWYIDGPNLSAELICGPSCLTQDETYRPVHSIDTSYTIHTLLDG